jgi:hypothetical protein
MVVAERLRSEDQLRQQPALLRTQHIGARRASSPARAEPRRRRALSHVAGARQATSPATSARLTRTKRLHQPRGWLCENDAYFSLLPPYFLSFSLPQSQPPGRSAFKGGRM